MKLFLVRLSNKISTLIKRFKILFQIYFIKRDIIKINFYDKVIINFTFLDKIKKEQKIDYQKFFDHKLSIFEDGTSDFINSKNVNYKYFKEITSEIDSEKVKKYNFINWHYDHKSKYEWDPDKLFWKKTIFNNNADIKVPRELSRFQHIPFDYNNKEISDEFILQVLDWISHNELYKGVNWACTMDVSLRVTNWIIILSAYKSNLSKYPNALNIIASSIKDHGEFIYDQLEYYGEEFPTDNHYLSNLIGLIYIGANFPQIKDSNIWLYFGIQELIKEMDKQVYDDGGNYESSSNYHRLVGELFLSASSMIEKLPSEVKKKLLFKININISKVKRFVDLNEICKEYNNNKIFLPISFYNKLLKMALFTFYLTKPNKLVPQFGDNDSGRAHIIDPQPKNQKLNHSHFVNSVASFLNENKLFYSSNSNDIDYLFYGKLKNYKTNIKYKLDKNLIYFKNSGIVISKNKNAWLSVFCMPNGKNGNGGHNHNDKLSFELNVFNKDIVVDGGCPFYSNYPELRNSYRSTKAHNTIQLGFEEQDKWKDGIEGLFRLEEHSDPKIHINDNKKIICSHKGYNLKHERVFKLDINKLIIIDNFKKTNLKRVINFNLGLNINPKYKIEDNRILFDLEILDLKKFIKVEIKGVKNPIISKGFYSEGYGIKKDNLMVSLEMDCDIISTSFLW